MRVDPTMKQAMIFAAGMGTRLKPLTDVIPKALVPVGDKPLLQIVLERLLDADIRNVVVNAHHKSAQICNYLKLLQSYYDVQISISDESEQLLETGGGIRKAQGLFDASAPVLIHNVDILSNVDLAAFYDNIGDADAMLLVSERKTKRYLLFDDDLRLQGWTNIETGELRGRVGERRLAFSGIHVLWPSIFPLLEQMPERFPIMDFYLKVCADCLIRGYEQKDLRLLDVGKLDTLDQANEFITK